MMSGMIPEKGREKGAESSFVAKKQNTLMVELKFGGEGA